LLAACRGVVQLADTKWGVIGVQWRNVPCWYKPNSPASVPHWKSPTEQPWWEKAPGGWHKDLDRRHKNEYKFQNGRKL
jgi:hypothetical protein